MQKISLQASAVFCSRTALQKDFLWFLTLQNVFFALKALVYSFNEAPFICTKSSMYPIYVHITLFMFI